MIVATEKAYKEVWDQLTDLQQHLLKGEFNKEEFNKEKVYVFFDTLYSEDY
jgi:hypothetical protein